tara:strand:- start:601 stop:1545 length:945 start_codon:yes stop_codon:yes gene_type:complete
LALETTREAKACLPTLIVATAILLLSASDAIADHSPTHSRWSIEIGEDGSDIESVFLTRQGSALFPILIVNENLVSITISLNYTIPFDATITAPDSVTVSGSSDIELEAILRGVDVMGYEGGDTDIFEVIGTVTSRQGLPISVPGDSDSASTDAIIPQVNKMEIVLEDLKGPVLGGDEASITAIVTNEGNVEDSVSEVEVTTSCSELTIGNQASQLGSRTLKPNGVTSVEIDVIAPMGHPTKNCDIAIEAAYRGEDSTQRIRDSTTVSVQVAPQVEESTETQELVESLPAPSVLFGITALFASAYYRDPNAANR